ncbi:MAG: hypothetical protein K2X47_08055 [Bdellovibrionales bacterium]|nr:hypothetical protein [Bdellovibrionales bacterium]
MKVSILILLSFLINGLVACSSQPTKSLLEERADYGANSPPLGPLGSSGGVRYVPTRVPEKVVVAWLHAKELPSKDYFWGSWLSIVVAPEAWEMTKKEISKDDKRQVKRTQERPAVLRSKDKGLGK